jgi:Uncharacterized protein conserved in bacteria (DUF2252)
MTAKAIDDFISDNSAFETWLADHCEIDKKGLKKKHKEMSDGEFPFLRATYFRWARTIEILCPELKSTPSVLAVGDIHIENFGTWRNVEERLVWGINDFDEAARMPYALDLVRLATSARLAQHVRIEPKELAKIILAGYRTGLDSPRPTLLDRNEEWMIRFLVTTDDDRSKFRREIEEYDTVRKVDPHARRGLIESLPKGVDKMRFATRRGGLGSLGRRRFVVIATWREGTIVREAKAQVPSAWDWAHKTKRPRSRLMDAAWSGSRSPDPYLIADERFVVRRRASDADKIEVKKLSKDKLQGPEVLTEKLFNAMGIDLGSFHSGDRNAAAVRKDVSRRDDDWLHHAAEAAEEQVRKDYDEWTKAHPKNEKKKKKKK